MRRSPRPGSSSPGRPFTPAGEAQRHAGPPTAAGDAGPRAWPSTTPAGRARSRGLGPPPGARRPGRRAPTCACSCCTGRFRPFGAAARRAAAAPGPGSRSPARGLARRAHRRLPPLPVAAAATELRALGRVGGAPRCAAPCPGSAREFPFELIHAHYAVPAGDAVRRAAPGVPTVVSVHGGDVHGAGAAGPVVARRARPRRARAGQQRRNRRALPRTRRGRRRVVHLGADLPRRRVRGPAERVPDPRHGRQPDRAQAPRRRDRGPAGPGDASPGAALRDRRRRP